MSDEEKENETDDGGDEEVQKLIETAGDMFGTPAETIPPMLERQLGFDITEVSEEDAKKARKALTSQDMDKFQDVALSYDVDEDAVTQFCDTVRQTQANRDPPKEDSEGNADGGSEEPADTTPSQNVTADDIDRKIEQAVSERMPDASDIAKEIRNQTGAGGQAAPQQPAQAPQGPQGEAAGQQNQIALELAKQFLSSQSGGGGELAELGQEVQKQAMESFIQEMRKPSLGDVIEMQFYEKAAPQLAEGMMHEVGIATDGDSDFDISDMFNGGSTDDDGEKDDE